MDRERWRLFCRDHPIEGCSLREQGVIDYRYTDILFCMCSKLPYFSYNLKNILMNIFKNIFSRHLDTRFLFFGTTRSLQIIGLKEEDKGTYMCRAENREDSVDAVAHIQVQGKHVDYSCMIVCVCSYQMDSFND